ncbi:hypothetical protein [Rhizobium sp. HT1-10]|uniref:hypothetical protein n=1 Tax=Rhizobium sp. HT1-10 TaxID=3111638 RepID=UPI003C1DB151
MRKYAGLAVLSFSLATAAIAADGAKAPEVSVNPNERACLMVKAAEMEKFVGAPARIRETSRGLCSWEGGISGVYMEVMYFKGESLGVPAGAERAYFEQGIEVMKTENKPEEILKIPDLGESAWGLKTAENATNFYAVYLFKNKDSMTIMSNGVGYDSTVKVARLAASRM